MSSPRNLGEFAQAMDEATAIYKKLTICEALIKYLKNPDADLYIDMKDTATFCQRLMEWMASVGSKICVKALEAALLVADRIPLVLKHHATCLFPMIIERLADSKEQVRHRLQELFIKLLEKDIMTPQAVLDRLTAHGFRHKNSVVREESLKCLVSIITVCEPKSLHFSATTPVLLKLYSDQNEAVREKALIALVEIYKAVGDKLKTSIKKNYLDLVSPQRLNILFSKFDEVREPDNPLYSIGGPLEGNNGDEVDQSLRTGTIKRTVRTPTTQRHVQSSVGSIDEVSFRVAFNEVTPISLYLPSDFREISRSLVKTIGNMDEDWEKRVEALKKFRSLMLADADSNPEFNELLKKLEIPFLDSLKDLRSQVVRETCITIAFLSERLKNKFSYFAEMLFSSLISLIPNSAKVMSTSATVAIKFIIDNCQNARFLSLIVSNQNSKSKEIRRAMSDFLYLIIDNWPNNILEKRHIELKIGLQKGIEDADSDARLCARKAFCIYKSKFPDKADELFRSLDTTYRRLLSDAASSHDSTTTAIQSRNVPPTPKFQTPASSVKLPLFTRAASAMDVLAAQRASVRAQYAAMNRLQVGGGTSVSRSQKLPELTSSTESTVERVARARSRVSPYSQSQPSSRSSSPSAHLSYHTPLTKRRTSTGRPTGIPAPLFTPYRGTTPPITPKSTSSSKTRPYLAEQMRQLSREADKMSALTKSSDEREIDGNHSNSPKKSSRFLEDYSDESETSSISSERSSNYTPMRGSLPDLNWDKEGVGIRGQWNEPKYNINNAIQKLNQSSWSDRREGLYILQSYLAKLALSPTELKKVTQALTKMFLDSQTKIYTLFLDTLQELIIRHRGDLNFWLFTILSKLFIKLGQDCLPSVEKKTQTILSLVRNTFNYENQLNEILRFFAEPSSYNTPVKVAALQYLSLLTLSMTSSQFKPPPNRDYTAAALTRLIRWMDIPDLQSHSQECIISLFNLNPTFMAKKISELGKKEQDIIKKFIVIKHHKAESLPTASPSPQGPQAASENSVKSEDIMRTPRKSSVDRWDFTVSSTDSGVCQISPAERELIERFASIQVQESGNSWQGQDEQTTGADNPSKDSDADPWTTTMEILDHTQIESRTHEQKMKAITKLSKLIAHCDNETLISHLMMIIKVILNLMPRWEDEPNEALNDDWQSCFMCAVIRALTDILSKRELAPYFAEFTDLLLLKIMNVMKIYKDKLLLNYSEDCIKAMARVLPVSQTLAIFQIYALSEIPAVAYCTIQAMSKLVEDRPKEEIEPYLSLIMKISLEAFESEFTMVRKAVTCCIVSVRIAFGEEAFAPYMKKLTDSKKRLVMTYIERKEKSLQLSPSSTE